MQRLLLIIKNIKNLLPYLLLVAIYFLFVNIEAKNDKTKLQKNNNHANQSDTDINTDESLNKNSNFTINIPVIPYEEEIN